MRRVRATAVLGALVVLACLIAPGGVLAAAEGEHGGGGLINIDKSLGIQIINFGILLFILWKLLYKPLVAKMEERTQAIKKSLDEAQAARAEAQTQREQHAQNLRAAHAEAQAIRAAAVKEAAEEQRKLVDAARAEAARLVASARAELDQDVRRAREQLRREVADLAIGAAEQLMRRSLRDDDHRRIVQDALTKLESTPAQDRAN